MEQLTQKFVALFWNQTLHNRGEVMWSDYQHMYISTCHVCRSLRVKLQAWYWGNIRFIVKSGIPNLLAADMQRADELKDWMICLAWPKVRGGMRSLQVNVHFIAVHGICGLNAFTHLVGLRLVYCKTFCYFTPRCLRTMIFCDKRSIGMM
jgi:hypothetical protein